MLSSFNDSSSITDYSSLIFSSGTTVKSLRSSSSDNISSLISGKACFLSLPTAYFCPNFLIKKVLFLTLTFSVTSIVYESEQLNSSFGSSKGYFFAFLFALNYLNLSLNHSIYFFTVTFMIIE